MKPELIKLLREEAHNCVDKMTPERLCHFVGYEQDPPVEEATESPKEEPVKEEEPKTPEPPKENETISEMKKRLTPLVIKWRNKKAKETGETNISILKGLYKKVSGKEDILFDDLSIEEAKEVERIVTGG